MNSLRKFGQHAKTWPFEEARKVLNRANNSTKGKGYVLFETGYGPSGLPHIGTFGEVVRTTMVRQAFQVLSDTPTRLFAFSDDMDGLRSVPKNIPNPDNLIQHLGKPLTEIPDPYGTHQSFGDHNNALLCNFLDTFEFDYEFQSATECYRSGKFDSTLLLLLENLDAVTQIILPTLGKERQTTYCPFLPICPETGVVLQVPAIARDTAAGTVTFKLEDDKHLEVPVTGGHCKLQWKADWAMRWVAHDVDYEMSGKDLIESVRLSSRICKILGGVPPEGFTYELFLDENGEKISKSRGNGLSIDDWLRYAPQESLQLFMFNSPRKAKRLHFDVIPRHVDDYLTFLRKNRMEEGPKQLENPIWHIHGGNPPTKNHLVTFSLLLNLVSACNTEQKAVLWGFLSRYVPNATPNSEKLLDELVEHSIQYYKDFIKPSRNYRKPDNRERAALQDLMQTLETMPITSEVNDIQNLIYEVGKRHHFENLKDWFKAQYEILLGFEQGPRMGSFIALYGIKETAVLIGRVLSGEDISTN
ncbi:MAG: lysine--tRNA ligase [Pseudomonadota bacterium]|nr:lysine--tRNA ligase [Pseudomonadota bacterium]